MTAANILMVMGLLALAADVALVVAEQHAMEQLKQLLAQAARDMCEAAIEDWRTHFVAARSIRMVARGVALGMCFALMVLHIKGAA